MRRETSKEDVSMSQVTNEDSNNTHNANLSEFQYLFGLNVANISLKTIVVTAPSKLIHNSHNMTEF